MAKKMYYSEEEATQKLGLSADALENLVRDQKLRAFKDGPKNMFRVDEVDKLAEEGVNVEEEIELTPAESSSTSSSISLADSVAPTDTGKEDTVITAEGISIFDEEDLEVESADPMAKTQITTNMEDQVALDGSGSGSGLLDLTRESDDTSLGQVLDQIDMEGSGAASPITQEPVVTAVGHAEASGPIMVVAPDPMAGLFSGLVTGAAIIMVVLGAVVLAAIRGAKPAFLEILEDYKLVVLLASVVIVGAAGVVGLVLGQASQAKKTAS
ncbi:MAG: helix-turn-helix domain-containing protein [Phycisphaerae bacterium]|jgi:hypothetical protein